MHYGINNLSGKPSQDEIFNMLDYAKENNIEILDTADAYGNVLDIIGDFHKGFQKYFRINTKFTVDKNKTVKDQLEISIEKLNVQSVNTYFYHDYNDILKYPKVPIELLELKKSGLIKNIGISVYDNNQFEIAIDSAFIDVIQIPFNLLDNYKKRGDLLQKAKSKNKEMHVRSVYLQGLLFKDIQKIPAFLYPLIPYINQINSLIKKHDKSMDSVALQYVLSKQEIDFVVIGVDNHSQLAKNILDTKSCLPKKLIEELDCIEVKEQDLLYPYNWK